MQLSVYPTKVLDENVTQSKRIIVRNIAFPIPLSKKNVMIRNDDNVLRLEM